MSPDRADDQRFWDAHYRTHPDVWSGAPNAVLIDEIGDLHPATALDLGCGEGADAIWLAQQGWRVTAVDVSAVALARAGVHAADADVGDRITWERHDLLATFPNRSFDLVSAHYLHSPQQTHDRLVHQRAVRAVAAGGTLLLVGHASVAPWSWDQQARLPTAGEVLDGLHLAPGRWAVDVCEDRRRPATGPAGETATVIDSVVRVRRSTLRAQAPEERRP